MSDLPFKILSQCYYLWSADRTSFLYSEGGSFPVDSFRLLGLRHSSLLSSTSLLIISFGHSASTPFYTEPRCSLVSLPTSALIVSRTQRSKGCIGPYRFVCQKNIEHLHRSFALTFYDEALTSLARLSINLEFHQRPHKLLICSITAFGLWLQITHLL